MSEDQTPPEMPPVQATSENTVPNSNPYTASPAPPVQTDFSRPPVPSQASLTDRLVPASNPRSLIAYYLGVFGLIPGCCVVLSPAAIVLGIMGLKHFNKHPEAGGKAHSLTGIILGVLGLLGILGFYILIQVYRVD